MENTRLEQLANRLMEIPQELHDLQVEILNSSQSSQDIDKEISKVETALKVSIANKVDENGKKVYSNEDARKAAFAELTEDDVELNDLKEKSRQIQLKSNELRNDYDCISNEQRNIRTVLQFFADKKDWL